MRSETARFLPQLSVVDTTPEPAAPASPLQAWFDDRIPRGQPPSMQDSILIFGYFLKREKDQHLFSPSDIKRAFAEVDRKIPKSLLQIMGTLKRDRGLLCSPGEKRGRYALSPEGIHHVEALLGVAGARKAAQRKESPPPRAAEPDADEAPAHGAEKWDRLFRPRGGSGWQGGGAE